MPKQKASTVGFWFAFSVCLVCVSGVRAADPEPEARVDLLGVVRAYADAMLEHGRDHWGQPSPLFASLLNRETHDLFNFELDDVDTGYVRAKVSSERSPALFPADQARDERMFDASNPAHDEHLFSVLYQLSEVLGDAKYAQAADAAISYWVLNCQDQRTGMFAWGEHVGWHLPSDTWLAASGVSHGRIHELWQNVWPHYDRVYAMGPDHAAAMNRFALSQWRHQVRDHEQAIWSRHAHMDSDPVGRTGYEFPRLIGQHVDIWSRAYARSDDESLRQEMLEAIHTSLDRSIERAHPNGALGFGTRPDMVDRFALPSHLLMIVALHGSRDRLPPETVARIDKLIAMATGVVTALDHELEPGGRGYVNYATASTLEPCDPVKGSRYPAHSDLWYAWGQSSHTAANARRLLKYARAADHAPFRELGLAGARMYIGQDPPAEASKGRWLLPQVLADVIDLMIDAHEITGDRVFLDEAHRFARAGVELFLDETSPLPKIAASNHKSMRNVYESATGGDDLMFAFLRLHLATADAKD